MKSTCNAIKFTSISHWHELWKSIISNIEFTKCNRVLEGKERLLREQGKGKRSNSNKTLTAEDKKLLWEKEAWFFIS